MMPDSTLQTLFDGFDPAEVAAARAAHLDELHQLGAVSATRRLHRLTTRRLKSQAAVASVVPARLAEGESLHILSTGDVDVLTYTAHLLSGVTHFDQLLIATWRINRADLELIATWVDAGRIDRFDLVIDLRFARLSADEYSLAQQITADAGGRCVLALNHSKVTLLANDDTHLVIESSANVNTNNRIEQTAIHHSRELYGFYLAYYHGLGRRTRAR